MMVVIRDLLPAEKLGEVLKALSTATYVDGKTSAGVYARQVKNNLQVAPNTPESKAAGDLIIAALITNMAFTHAARPKQIAAPLFSRYETGMGYGEHLDDPIMRGPPPIRTDVAATIFLNDPSEYDGGELVIRTDAGEQAVKLKAGEAVVYPATFLHRVQPVTRGVRLAAVIWVQSLIRDAAQRAILYDLSASILRLGQAVPDRPELPVLRKCNGNLLRMWMDL